jgi:sugar O-acyltransferase (sialic acid O-acetyltransferase NeuD family)
MTVVFGASGHAKEIAMIARLCGEQVDFFVTAERKSSVFDNTPVITEDEFINKAHGVENKAFIAIGNPLIRKAIYRKMREHGLELCYPNLFHSSVHFDRTTDRLQLGEGNLFFPGTLLTTDIRIGNHNHFNMKVSISHDCILGDFNTLSPGVSIAGNVHMGSGNFVGLNAAIIDNIKIGDELKIGAGAVIIKDSLDSGTYVGVPAKRI